VVAPRRRPAPGLKRRPWPESADLRLRAFADMGATAAQAGAAIGRSKRAVIARAHRLGDVRFRPRPDLISAICRQAALKRIAARTGHS